MLAAFEVIERRDLWSGVAGRSLLAQGEGAEQGCWVTAIRRGCSVFRSLCTRQLEVDIARANSCERGMPNVRIKGW